MAAELALGRLPRAAVVVLRTVARAAGPAAEVHLVGGTVRDALLGRRPAPGEVDVDLALAAGAFALGRALADRLEGALVPLDPDRGVARVVARGVRVDLADFRVPGLLADLTARDFTVNALAVPVGPLLRAGRAPVVDPTGGLADLRARRLRLTAPRVLDEDPLRTLRGARLEAVLGFRLSPATARAVRAAAPGLGRVSAERVRDELLLVLALPASARTLRRLDALGLLAAVLPEVEPMRRCAQPAPHRFPVLEHSLRAVAAADRAVAAPRLLEPFGDDLAAHLAEPVGGGVRRAEVLKLAALLHDVAKPATRRVVGRRVRFFEHDTAGAAVARAIGVRLRLPERAVGLLERLVRFHLRPMHLAAAGGATARARYRFYRDLGADTRDLLLLTLVDAAAVRGEPLGRVWRRATLVRDLLAGWPEQQEVAQAPPLVRGGDVMTQFGLAPGPAVGRLLGLAREAQALGLVRSREEALAYLARHLGRTGVGRARPAGPE